MMENFVFIIFLLLCLGLMVSAFRRRSKFFRPRVFRFIIVVIAVAFYTLWFVKASSDRYIENSLTLQLINKLPQPVDFFVITVEKIKQEEDQFVLKHAGKIRPDHYRMEYLQMKNSSEYWIAGYIGRKNLVYFSQHAVPNKNMDQIVEIQNYINQSVRLSREATKLVEQELDGNLRISVWISLGLLLLFLNIVQMIRRK